MAHKDKIQLTIIIVAPPDQVEEGDRIFRSHAPWMEATHHRDGEKALLKYTVSKAPELSNPMDSNSAPTGNTGARTAANGPAHKSVSPKRWKIAAIGKCSMVTPGAPCSSAWPSVRPVSD